MWYNARRMKKGFTLVELLIVVVVLVTLMAMTFRLSSIGSSQSARTTTVSRLQKLENCLSGYYAAFGTYPPVPLHGSRNYELEVSKHGIQKEDAKDEPLKWNWYNVNSHSVTDSKSEREDWKKVRAACLAQPLDCKFPFPQTPAWDAWAQASSRLHASSGSSGLDDDAKDVWSGGFGIRVTGLSAYNNESDWRTVQMFQFGLMSFLLPRYLLMMSDSTASASSSLYRHEQWTANNTKPCDPLSGTQFSDWSDVQRYASSTKASDIAHVANIPSQAVCARWLPNLEGICQYGHEVTFFGVDIRMQESKDAGGPQISPGKTEIYSPGNGDSTSGQYILDSVTVLDGWGHPFYYYSPPPYQSYVLWSSGLNERTFPPWVSRELLSPDAKACVGYWTEDDVVNMSH